MAVRLGRGGARQDCSRLDRFSPVDRGGAAGDRPPFPRFRIRLLQGSAAYHAESRRLYEDGGAPGETVPR